MANKSLTIVVSTPRSLGDVTSLVKNVSQKREEMRALSHYFHRLASGDDKGVGSVVNVSYSASAPVRATNTLTLTYASISNNDTVVIAGLTLTCVTATPSGNAQFQKLTDAPTTALNLVKCINANPTLSALMSATNVAGVVTLTLNVYGAVGNQVPLVGSTGIVAGASKFASGAGGSEVANVSYIMG